MHSICRPVNTMGGRLGDPAFDRRLTSEARDELRRLRELRPPSKDEYRLSSAFDRWSSALGDFDRLTEALDGEIAPPRREPFATRHKRCERSRG
jgi:hypothetical protein